MRALLLLFIALLLSGCGPSTTLTHGAPRRLDTERLDAEIAAIAARAAPARLEVAVQSLDGGEVWAWDRLRAYPLQSVFKAPLGAAVLAEVDAGRLSLDEVVILAEKDISPAYSPVADAWPGRVDYSVGELLVRAVGGSDNTAADVLMRKIGGPGAITAWLRANGVHGLRVDRYERELQPEIYGMASFRIGWKGWPAFRAARDTVPEATRRAATARYLTDPRDTATASGALLFLGRLANGQLLSPKSTALLLKIMTETTTGQNRLKAGLPEGARLAHKTGTSGTDLGLTPVVNDIGVVTLKDGRRLGVVVFLAGSTQDETARDQIFADTMRAIIAAAD